MIGDGLISVSSVFFVFSLASFIAFLLHEKTTRNPMIPLQLFTNREFTGSALTSLTSNVFLVAVTVLLPTFFTRIQSRSELIAALLVTPITVAIFIFSPISALLIKRLGARIIIAGGFALMFCSYVLFATINMNNIPIVIATCAVLGSGYGIIVGPITVLAASNFTGDLLTSSQSVIGVIRQIGVVLAVAIYVSCLYSNLSTARSDSVAFIQSTVQKIDVPHDVQKQIELKAITALDSNSPSEDFSTNHFSSQEINNMIEGAYQQTLTTYQSTISEQQKQRIHDTVASSVRQQIKKLNRSINTAIASIQQYAKSRYTQAFTSLYYFSIPFVAISVCFFILFPRKQQDVKLYRTTSADSE
ncbi:MFS transporter [Alloscardovia theropitheci]|uniref:MFS transporter n=1 Tax=Alloscardovia theropitheci TaxID=2496842 RepID=UPI00196A24D3|nr:MFS transporter [Alloscardovia theropitheci]